MTTLLNLKCKRNKLKDYLAGRTKTIGTKHIWSNLNLVDQTQAKSHCIPFSLSQSYPFVIPYSAYLTPHGDCKTQLLATVRLDLSTVKSKDGNLVCARNRSELRAPPDLYSFCARHQKRSLTPPALFSYSQTSIPFLLNENEKEQDTRKIMWSGQEVIHPHS